MKDIGKFIKEFRIKNHLTQTAFGKIVGVNKQTVSKWETGTMQPSTDKFFEIAKAIGISANSILKADGPTGENMPFVYTHKTKYDAGINYMYHSVHDFNSFCLFIDAIDTIHRLSKPNAEYIGFLLIDSTFESTCSHEEAIVIYRINWDMEKINIEMPTYTLPLTNEMVSHIDCAGSFNNEVYGFTIHLSNEQESFLQIIMEL